MSDPTKEERDAFFAAMKEMEQQHVAGNNKAKFVDNVVSGREQVSFAVIDRCREAVLQIRQCHYVFETLYQRYAHTQLGLEHKPRLDELKSGADATDKHATAALNAVISWVPAAVNTRANP